MKVASSFLSHSVSIAAAVRLDVNVTSKKGASVSVFDLRSATVVSKQFQSTFVVPSSPLAKLVSGSYQVDSFVAISDLGRFTARPSAPLSVIELMTERFAISRPFESNFLTLSNSVANWKCSMALDNTSNPKGADALSASMTSGKN